MVGKEASPAHYYTLCRGLGVMTMERQCTQGLLFLEEDVRGFSLLTVYVWFTSAASRAGIEGGTMHACTTPPTMNTLHKYSQ